MVRYVVQTTLIIFVIMFSLGISPSVQTEMMNLKTVTAQSESPSIIIQRVNLEVEKNGVFLPLGAFIIDDPTTDIQLRTPQFLNKSALRVNTTYSTVIGQSKEIVIHFFAIEVYEVITGKEANFTVVAGISPYSYNAPEELVLLPNSSKSEVVKIPSLILPNYGNFKFVFKVQYHTREGDTKPKNAYFAQNMSFQLVESLPEPPYVLLFIFYSVTFVLIAYVILGIYGSRKYKNLDQ